MTLILFLRYEKEGSEPPGCAAAATSARRAPGAAAAPGPQPSPSSAGLSPHHIRPRVVKNETELCACVSKDKFIVQVTVLHKYVMASRLVYMCMVESGVNSRI
jgi:hypothetical protein